MHTNKVNVCEVRHMCIYLLGHIFFYWNTTQIKCILKNKETSFHFILSYFTGVLAEGRNRIAAVVDLHFDFYMLSYNYLSVPKSNPATYGDRCFSVAAPKLWNSLPGDFRYIENLCTFKTSIKTWLFKSAFNLT